MPALSVRAVAFPAFPMVMVWVAAVPVAILTVFALPPVARLSVCVPPVAAVPPMMLTFNVPAMLSTVPILIVWVLPLAG